MSRHMWERPTHVWLLPEGQEAEPRRLEEGEISEAFDRYSDTGYEPKLDWLYKTLSCSTIDMRELPGLGHMWLDDEGLLKERQISPVATVLYQSVYVQQSPVVGTCLLVVYPQAAKDGLDQMAVSKAWEAYKRYLKGVN